MTRISLLIDMSSDVWTKFINNQAQNFCMARLCTADFLRHRLYQKTSLFLAAEFLASKFRRPLLACLHSCYHHVIFMDTDVYCRISDNCDFMQRMPFEQEFESYLSQQSQSVDCRNSVVSLYLYTEQIRMHEPIVTSQLPWQSVNNYFKKSCVQTLLRKPVCLPWLLRHQQAS